ncbi:CoA-transferase [Rhodococcus wratislaviensis]|uniref:Putative CoA-transferase alpha subunit n=1 Tax=Rhodococcus wratislaviensis NBRC 100605 TaxID=1219028 RepID=X0PWE7_RHOWR|nr:CoA-transferase [Rhodococcus wratislaviensis]GAF47613.1 putative CoA-transferase alpha subunit [Rhodococcus wratislaviensis NBRC 100605]
MKVATLPEIEALLADSRRVALGGMLLENRPSTLVRALIRSAATDLFLASAPAASWDADVLIGLGRVSTVRIPHISLAGVGLAPASRKAFADGTVRFEDCDEALLLGGYLAANHEVSVQVLENMGTNDLVDDNPLVVRSGEVHGVAPLKVDTALLHAPIGDVAGNLVHFGSRWADLMIARSADRVIVQVDRLVPTAYTAKLGVSVPGYLVDKIVEAPYGAHPLGSVGSYVADLEHLASYQSRVTSEGLANYAAEHCEVGHDDYLQTIGATRLAQLEREAA